MTDRKELRDQVEKAIDSGWRHTAISLETIIALLDDLDAKDAYVSQLERLLMDFEMGKAIRDTALGEGK